MTVGQRVIGHRGKPAGRRVSLCTSLRYSARVDARRKKLGKIVRRARERADYGSQRAFAAALGVHERSVAAVERGEKVGETVLGHIEDNLFPDGSIARFLETGDEALLHGAPTGQSRGQAEAERIAALSRAEMLEEADSYDRSLGEGAGDEWMEWAMDVRRRMKAKPRGTREPSSRDAETANSRK
jgi:DNA-binding XRE family transcriptional regulator